ncbi:ABC transporter permease subunit [Cellulomonas massiliensis]|uniref:ABC transporter permease subunit n=1 Tax=Cellulomonas massiliensis TaxID=1465811 RepID=UPI0002EB9904|nr:ABC transporter permease subunit [Cellulomonas massiliensis]
MTTTTDRPAAVPADRAETHRVTFGHLVRSEWIKFWTLRSTIWTLALLVVVMVGLVALITSLGDDEGGAEGAGAGPLGLVALTPAVNLASLAVVVLGVLTITGEYSTGMIRSSLTAAPRRTPVLAAKAVVVGVAIFVTSAVAVALSYVVELLTLGDEAPDLASSETQRVLVGSVLYVTTIALFAFALGALLRHSAAAMATVLGLMLVIEPVVNAIPWQPLKYVAPFLPSSAGGKVLQPDAIIDLQNQATTVGADLSAWQGFAVLVVWVVVVYAAAAVLLRRRDA